MWSRLIYLTLDRAFQPVTKTRSWFPPALKGKYRAQLTKEFKVVGLPSLFNPPKDDSKNPRHRKPKGSKYEILHAKMRHEKVSNALLKADDEILKYRQEALNRRKYRGFDRVIKEVMPDWADLVREDANKDN